MRILIVGAGEVGYHLADRLSQEGSDVVVIDRSEEKVHRVEEHLDVQVLRGNGASPGVLMEAGVEQADLLVAVTTSDEVNVVACLIGAQARTRTRVARIRDPGFFQHGHLMSHELLQLSYAINPESEVVHLIEQMIGIPRATDLAEFAQGKVVVVGFRIGSGCPLLGRPLKDLWDSGVTRQRLLIAGIYRQRGLLIPRGTDQVLEGDVVLVVHQADRLHEIYPILGLQSSPVSSVVIAGASHVGVELALALERRGLKVKLIEPDQARCLEVSDRLERTLILHGEPTDPEILEEEGCGEAQVFVAAGRADDTNILVSLLARNMGVRRVFTLVNQVSFIPLVQAAGIDVAICPKLVAVSRILQYIRRGKVLSVASLRHDEAEALEVLAEEGSLLVLRPIQDLKLPRGVIVGAIVREEEVLIPDGRTRILPGDHVVFFCQREALPLLERLLDRAR